MILIDLIKLLYCYKSIKNKKMGDTSKIIAAALAGAVVGAGVALLLAPASGKETR